MIRRWGREPEPGWRGNDPIEQKGRARRRLGTKQVAAAVLLLLVVEIGYVVHLNSSPSTSSLPPEAPPPLSILPSTTAPPPAVATPTIPFASAAPSTADASPKPATAASATTGRAAPPGYCTDGDLDFMTTTDSGTYSPGETVKMVMEVTDVTPCIFQPEAVGASGCPSTLVVTGDGSQVFPNSGYGENCDPPPAQAMNPGSEEAVSAVWVIPSDWDQTSSPGNSYQAVGEWGWSAGTGQAPDTIDIGSQLFTIS